MLFRSVRIEEEYERVMGLILKLDNEFEDEVAGFEEGVEGMCKCVEQYQERLGGAIDKLMVM